MVSLDALPTIQHGPHIGAISKMPRGSPCLCSGLHNRNMGASHSVQLWKPSCGHGQNGKTKLRENTVGGTKIFPLNAMGSPRPCPSCLTLIIPGSVIDLGAPCLVLTVVSLLFPHQLHIAALPQSQRSSTPSSEIGATPPSSPHHILTWQTG